MVFDINIDDVLLLKDLQNNKCKYSGREFVWKINTKNKTSIDRIDSSKGYTKNNIQLVCFEVNQAKNNLSEKVFLNLIADIYNNTH